LALGKFAVGASFADDGDGTRVDQAEESARAHGVVGDLTGLSGAQVEDLAASQGDPKGFERGVADRLHH
jgi:hypothetical protein